ncbi:MAG: DUF4296 domain-containing protein [Candidatus Cryptobacteroides sp.]
MKRKGFIVLTVLLLFLSIGGCKRKARVIPENKLADIYAEMFLADQWLSTNYSYKRVADTTLFYEPIFEKYGYNLEDFNESMRYYVKKPDKYAKILKTAGLKLDAQAKRLKKVEDYYNNRERFSPYIPKTFNLETLMSQDTMMTVCVRDIYNSLIPVLADSLAVQDSLAVMDTLFVDDSLSVEDAVPVKDSVELKIEEVKKDSIRFVKPQKMRPTVTRPMARPVDSIKMQTINTKKINDNE